MKSAAVLPLTNDQPHESVVTAIDGLVRKNSTRISCRERAAHSFRIVVGDKMDRFISHVVTQLGNVLY